MAPRTSPLIRVFFEHTGGVLEGEAWRFEDKGIWVKEKITSPEIIFVSYSNIRFARVLGDSPKVV